MVLDMNLRSTFVKAALVASSFGMTMNAQAQSSNAQTSANTNTVTNNVSPSVKPNAYTIYDYATRSNAMRFSSVNRNYDINQRYSYINLYKERKMKSIDLRNLVTTLQHTIDEENVTFKTFEESGGLYFAHGYDKFSEADTVKPAQFKNVDLDRIAATLISRPAFSLKMTGHTDTSGDSAKNYALSESRLETGKKMLLSALERQGLTNAEAEDVYKTRIAPHTTIEAQGEASGPIKTSDGVKEQGNRVVTFQLIAQQVSSQQFERRMVKFADFDNHEHTVVLRITADAQQTEIPFYPEFNELKPGQVSVADENTNFVIKIAPDIAKPFVINHFVSSNLVADNTNFLIESDTPGDVKSTYNFKDGMIDISLNNKVVLRINNMNNNIDPNIMRIGQVDKKGNVVISPLTNAAAVEPLSKTRRTATDDNVLSQTADRILYLSIDAKALHRENMNNEDAYLQALKDYGFAEKLNAALQDLQKSGIETGIYEQFVLTSYTDPGSDYYTPDQIVVPFQTYEGLLHSQPYAPGATQPSETVDAYKELLTTVQKASKPLAPSAKGGKVSGWSLK